MTGWTLRDWRSSGLILGGLVPFVLVVYGAVVVGGGWLLGRTSIPGDVLAVLATAVVALGFDPVHDRLMAVPPRTLRAGQPSPCDVLRGFLGAVRGQYAVERWLSSATTTRSVMPATPGELPRQEAGAESAGVTADGAPGAPPPRAHRWAPRASR